MITYNKKTKEFTIDLFDTEISISHEMAKHEPELFARVLSRLYKKMLKKDRVS